MEVWFRGTGYALEEKRTSTVCNWDGTDCYNARIYPHIDEISAIGGSAKGGQKLRLTGGDFKHAKSVEVTVDDVPCRVTSTSESVIECETGAKTLGAPQAAYPGEHGLIRIKNGERQLMTNF